MKPHKASSTAHLIAASTVFLSQEPKLKTLIPSDWAEPCSWFVQDYSRFGKILLQWIQKPWCRHLVKALERRSVPGIMMHYILRKHFIDQIVRQSLLEGFEQIIVLGAGFDTLVLRHHRDFSRVNFIEIDFPATQAVKKKALQERGLPEKNFHFLPVDFTFEQWNEKLSAHPVFNPKLKTVFVAEGVLMYLDEKEVKNTFSILSRSVESKQRVIFTFMEIQPDGTFSFVNSAKGVDRWLKFKQEPFRWGIKPADLPGFLKPFQLSMDKIVQSDDLRDKYLSPIGLASILLAKGESICVAENF